MKSSTDSYYYIALAVLTLVNIWLGLFNIHLFRSGITFDFATGLVFNMAILSLVIVVSGVLVTVFGLARLQSIQDKAIQSATEEARIVARDTVSEKVKEEVEKNIKTLYDKEKEDSTEELLKALLFEVPEEEENEPDRD